MSAEFDPVPTEYLLSVEKASLYIPERFVDISSADVTPREFALQVLTDGDPEHQYELSLFQRAARGDAKNVFEVMNVWMGHGGGRHTQQVIIAMCLHPLRDTMIDVASAGKAYLEASSRTPDEIMNSSALLGYLATEAFCNVDTNSARVQAGDIHVPQD